MDEISYSYDATPGFQAGHVVAKKYLLQEPLGTGGMGQVWTAQNLDTGAEVAIKLLLDRCVGSADFVGRLRREAHLTAQLAHRGIVRIFDLVELPDDDGSAAIVMERLRGETLARHLARNAPLTAQETLEIVSPLLAALQYAHSLGIVHCDLKPENILLALEPDGQIIPKLLDFGVSKVLRSPPSGHEQIVGTPSYMSPEAVLGREVDERSDLFCAGILLYVCLTGKNPFASEKSPARLTAVLDAIPVRPAHVSSALWRVIERALAKDPVNRFSSATELADALARSTHAPRSRSMSERERATETLRIALGPPPRWGTWALAAVVCIAGCTFASLSGSTRAVAGMEVGSVPAARSERASPRRLLASVDRLSGSDTSSSVVRRAALLAPPRRSPNRPPVVRSPGL